MHSSDLVKLRTHYDHLVSKLNFEDVEVALQQKGVLTCKDCAIVKSAPTRTQQIRELIKIISSQKKSDSLTLLIECMKESDYKELAELLEKPLSDDAVDSKTQADELEQQVLLKALYISSLHKELQKLEDDLKQQLNVSDLKELDSPISDISDNEFDADMCLVPAGAVHTNTSLPVCDVSHSGRRELSEEEVYHEIAERLRKVGDSLDSEHGEKLKTFASLLAKEQSERSDYKTLALRLVNVAGKVVDPLNLLNKALN